jgi:hypothetical protein
MAIPLGGNGGGLGVPTTIVGDVDGGPLGGDVGGLGAPTTIVGDVDGGAPGRQS